MQFLISFSSFSFQTCAYYKKHGANIGCWIRQCRKSFHLPCAKKYNCVYEFNDDFRSYFDVHFAVNTLNTSETHSLDEICGICDSSMGPHNSVQSIQVVCCADNRWYHKACLKQIVFTLNDNFDCPTCDNRDEFRRNMQANGIYIPNCNYMPKPVEIQAPKSKRRRTHKDWIREPHPGHYQTMTVNDIQRHRSDELVNYLK